MQQLNYFTDITALAKSIHELTRASRLARTGMHNAMQMTLLHDLMLEGVDNSAKDKLPKETEQPSTSSSVDFFGAT